MTIVARALLIGMLLVSPCWSATKNTGSATKEIVIIIIGKSVQGEAESHEASQEPSIETSPEASPEVKSVEEIVYPSDIEDYKWNNPDYDCEFVSGDGVMAVS